MNIKMKKRRLIILLCCFVFLGSGLSVHAASTGWIKSGHTYKYKIGKSYIKNKVQKIRKDYYYFDKKGNRKSGWIKYKKNKYYFNKKTGKACIGKTSINNNFYMFRKNGVLITKKGIYKRGGKEYFITKNGRLAVGVKKVKRKNFLFSDTGIRLKGNGIKKCVGKNYYLYNGELKAGWIKTGRTIRHFNEVHFYMDKGWTRIGENTYYFDQGGSLQTGWFTNLGNIYYLGNDGSVQHGIVTVGKNTYYFDEYGKMAINRWVNYGGNTYYVEQDGRVKKNCWYNGKYFDNKGRVVNDAIEYNSSTQGQVTQELLDSLSISSCTKLMVVAHPDDETLWGGAHLTQGGYFVVCLTNGYNEVRKKEFYKVMDEFGCKGLILSYPDLVNGQRSDWSKEKYQIAKDLDVILKYKHWGLVATHNPAGEYGHIHHKFTSKLVTERFYHNGWGNSLFYFGLYYPPSYLPKIQKSLKKVPVSSSTKKIQVARSVYKSQESAINARIHMAEYEDWILANNWSD